MRVIVVISREVEVPDKFLSLMNDECENYFELHQEFCEYIPKVLDMPLSTDITNGFIGDSIDGVYEK